MYGKVFASLWTGSMVGQGDAQLVFCFMIARAERDGTVDETKQVISLLTGLPMERVESAISILESEDPISRSPEEDGRRIVRLDRRDWGWRIVNYLRYRETRDGDDRRAQNREAQQRYRDKHPSATVSRRKPRSAHAEAEAEVEGEAEAEKTTPTPSAPSGKDASPTVFVLPLRDGTDFKVTQDDVVKWERFYPDVLILDTLREQAAWLDSNPTRRKTKRGMKAFINRWLLKEQNHPNGAPNGQKNR